MTKADFVEKVAARTGLSKDKSEKAITAFLAAIEDALVKEKKVTLTGFGSFTVETRPARTGRNPRSGEPIAIPQAQVVKFRAGKLLKEAVN